MKRIASKYHHGLMALMVVLCAGLMAQVLLGGMHDHHASHAEAHHCLACMVGPFAALLLAAIIVAPAPARDMFSRESRQAVSSCRIFRQRLRGPPVHF